MTDNKTGDEAVAEMELLEPDAYGDEAPLTYVFGDSARVRILSAFLTERGRDINISDVARLAGVARSTVYNHIDALERLGVIEHTRDIEQGHSSLYRFNEDSDLAQMLYLLEGKALEVRDSE